MLDKKTSPIKQGITTQIQEQGTEKVKKTGKKPIKKIIYVFIGLVFVIVAVIAIYSSYELYRIKSPNYQKQIIEKQTKDIINAVGKLIELPDDIPQIATVTNVDTLKKDQPFFDKAKNGDQLLIFQKEVILYRPSINKIINVGPIISTTPQTVNQQIPTETPIPTKK